MTARMAGRVGLVTGAGSGIGRATALRLAAEGARVGITDIDPDGLAATAAAVAADGAEVVAVPGDIVDPATADALVTAAVDRFGRVDALVNNVGILIMTSLLETTPDDFDRLMRVNCLSHLIAIQRVVPEMRRAGAGSIVNIASVGALVALPQVSAYCASKSAVLGLTRSAAYEFAPEIRVNAVCPGGVDTPMSRRHLDSFADKAAAMTRLTGRQLLHRYADPDEIARVCVFLASDEASFVTGAMVAAEAGHSSW
jgi:NAD(P)-dependent dehydrogenase (short-subunit alcohol dehydrogenase family)